MKKRISDESVERATGKSWKEWMEILKAASSAAAGHKELVSYLSENHGLSSWWCQTVAVRYEQESGKRQVGETAGVGFQIGVRKTFPLTLEQAWELLISTEGLSIWLGYSSEDGSSLTDDDTYNTGEASGVVRVFKPHSHLRLTWHPPEWERPSTIQVRVIPQGAGKTTVSFHQENLPDAESRERMRSRWKKVLEVFEDRIRSES
jgi:uncharacterized protein YndB with AHSA1/START domain